MMNRTQDHLSILDIEDDIILLKDGGAALVLQTSAVNFGLLSAGEQMAIITAFAQMLNSLSFPIQIVIHSERLNISSYLNILDKAYTAQTNPLLKEMMSHYRQFVQTTIKENEVLDKKFYLIIPLYKLELGLTASAQILRQKVKTVLLPRRDQLLRQLNRVGLKATQLTGEKLLETFFALYNFETMVTETPPPSEPVKLKQPKMVATAPATPQPAAPTPPMTSQAAKTHPFVVEELEG